MRTIIVPVTICVQSGRGPFLLAFGHRLNLRFMPEYIVNESPRRRRLEAPERDQRHRAAQTVADDLKLRQLSRDDLVAHRPGGQQRHAQAALDHSLDEEGVVRFERQVGPRAYLIEELIGRPPDRSAPLEEYQLLLLYLRDRRDSLPGQRVFAAHDQRKLVLEEFRHLQRSEEHTSELQSRPHLVCRLLLEKKKKKKKQNSIQKKKKKIKNKI